MWTQMVTVVTLLYMLRLSDHAQFVDGQIRSREFSFPGSVSSAGRMALRHRIGRMVA